MRFGARTLFEDVTCTFLPGRRYAVTGPNGAGKSTLMKILTGDIEPTKGSITRPKKFGVLRQDQFAFDEFRVIDTVIMGNIPLWKALASEGDLRLAVFFPKSGWRRSEDKFAGLKNMWLTFFTFYDFRRPGKDWPNSANDELLVCSRF